MATITDHLRRQVAAYGSAGALRAFQMDGGFGGWIPGAVPEGASQVGGLSKAAARAGEWVSSVLHLWERGRAPGGVPAARALHMAPEAARAAVTAAGNYAPVNNLFQAGGWSETVTNRWANSMTSNLALQAANARYPAVFGVAGGGTPMLAAGEQSAALAASAGVAAGLGTVSGDGSAYRDLAAASSGTAGGAVVQVEMVNHNSVSSELDLDRVVSYLTDKVAEGLQSAAEGVHW